MPDAETLVRHWLAELDADGTCLARLVCDRHPEDDVAVTVVEPDVSRRDITYGELAEESRRLTVGLTALGIGPGDRVAGLLSKRAELVTTVLATWRLGAVYVPLFTAFAPAAIAERLTGSDTKVVVCDAGQRAKLSGDGETDGSAPYRVVIVDGDPLAASDVPYGDLLLADAPDRPAAVYAATDPCIELFTSGTTGRAKGVLVPVRALAGFRSYLTYGLDLRPEDVYWNAADPGWAYGLYYAVVAPLLTGRRTILLHAPFSPELSWKVLAGLRVTNFAAAPTVYRSLRASGAATPDAISLRVCSSAGEPLDAEVVEWATRELGVSVRDHYGQTELGMVVANHHHPDFARPLRPGSMGHPSPGWTVDVLHPELDVPLPAGEVGRIVVDVAGSPLFTFGGYHGDPERTAERFTSDGRWYLTGDAGSKDADGYLYFSGRDDDVILSAGYRIGPFEVETVLLEHPAVAEAAVVGVPDALRGEVIVAFVTVGQGHAAPDALEAELQQIVKQRYAAHAYPRRVHIVDALPRTPSGKVQRFVLRQRAVEGAQELEPA